jgi:hypothetical protein
MDGNSPGIEETTSHVASTKGGNIMMVESFRGGLRDLFRRMKIGAACGFWK